MVTPLAIRPQREYVAVCALSRWWDWGEPPTAEADPLLLVSQCWRAPRGGMALSGAATSPGRAVESLVALPVLGVLIESPRRCGDSVSGRVRVHGYQ